MSDAPLPIFRHSAVGAEPPMDEDARALERRSERRRSVPPRPLVHVLGAWWEQVQPLLRQQCWCWLWDVRWPEGDLLLQRRFERTQPT